METKREVAVYNMKFWGEPDVDKEHLIPPETEFKWMIAVRYEVQKGVYQLVHYEGAVGLSPKKRPSAMNRAYPVFFWSHTTQAYEDLLDYYQRFADDGGYELLVTGQPANKPKGRRLPVPETPEGDCGSFSVPGVHCVIGDNGEPMEPLETIDAPKPKRFREDRDELVPVKARTLDAEKVKEFEMGLHKNVMNPSPMRYIPPIRHEGVATSKGTQTSPRPAIGCSTVNRTPEQEALVRSRFKTSSVHCLPLGGEKFKLAISTGRNVFTVDVDREQILTAMIDFCAINNIRANIVQFGEPL